MSHVSPGDIVRSTRPRGGDEDERRYRVRDIPAMVRHGREVIEVKEVEEFSFHSFYHDELVRVSQPGDPVSRHDEYPRPAAS